MIPFWGLEDQGDLGVRGGLGGRWSNPQLLRESELAEGIYTPLSIVTLF